MGRDVKRTGGIQIRIRRPPLQNGAFLIQKQSKTMLFQWQCPSIILAASPHHSGSVPPPSWQCPGIVLTPSRQCPGIVLAASRHRSGSVPPPSWQCPGIVLAASPHRPGSAPPPSWQTPSTKNSVHQKLGPPKTQFPIFNFQSAPI